MQGVLIVEKKLVPRGDGHQGDEKGGIEMMSNEVTLKLRWPVHSAAWLAWLVTLLT